MRSREISVIGLKRLLNISITATVMRESHLLPCSTWTCQLMAQQATYLDPLESVTAELVALKSDVLIAGLAYVLLHNLGRTSTSRLRRSGCLHRQSIC